VRIVLPGDPVPPPGVGSFAPVTALAVFVVVVGVVGALTWSVLATDAGIPLRSAWTEHLPALVTDWTGYWSWAALIGDQLRWSLAWRWSLTAAVALVVGCATAGVAAYRPASTGLVHVRGRRLIADRAAMAQLRGRIKAELAGAAVGALLHADLPALARDRWTRGLLICGAIGSGKTVLLNHVVTALPPGSRVMIHDVKGDFTSATGREVALIAPWDRRSDAWDIGVDIPDRAAAQTWAEIVVPESRDPMWSSAARQVLVALLCTLQSAHQSSWGWRQLGDLLDALAEPDGQQLLERLIREHVPEAAATARALDTKTGQSVMVTLSSYLSPLYDLARAWSDGKARRRWSVRQWLDGDGSACVILQSSGRHAALARCVAGGIVGIAAAHVADPAYPESRERQTYLVLDELPQLGRIDGVVRLVEVGRSKGIISVLGLQDIAQLDRTYSIEDRKTIVSSCSTHVYMRTNAGETADELASALGEQEVERLAVTRRADGREPGQQSWQAHRVPVLTAAELASLRAGKAGCQGIVVGIGDDIYRVAWPILDIEQRRAAHEPAAWTVSGGGDASPAAPAAEAEPLTEPVAASHEPTPAAAPGEDHAGAIEPLLEPDAETPADVLADELLEESISQALGTAPDPALAAVGLAAEAIDIVAKVDEVAEAAAPADPPAPSLAAARRRRLRERIRKNRKSMEREK
jgi:hypothetical protein